MNNYIRKVRHRFLQFIYPYLFDQKINRRIVVFESDDWGSIRNSSKQDYLLMKELGYKMDERPYERYDILESDDDVKKLSKVLSSYQDSKGNPPIFTLNYLSSNPDFEKIRKSNFQSYYFESIACTYHKNNLSQNVIQLIKDGIDKGIFNIQFHGREHFNVIPWLKSLQQGDIDTLTAFMHNMCGIFPKDKPYLGNKYLIALRTYSLEEENYINQSLSEGLVLFKVLWGKDATSFIAPCYTWSDSIEKTLNKYNIKIIQSGRIQHLSEIDSERYIYTGKKNIYGQIYTVRNCQFEPSTSQRTDEVYSCLQEISKAFKNKNIAIISTHRINYVGGIDERRRDINLEMLHELITRILTIFPDVEFCSSEKLNNIILK